MNINHSQAAFLIILLVIGEHQYQKFNTTSQLKMKNERKAFIGYFKEDSSAFYTSKL